MPPTELNPKLVSRIRSRLLEFYDRDRRDLPWRQTSDPYRIWVSEVMLQQTRVETVIPFYRGWMERFPDLRSLAEAELDEVLTQWKGLGYYRRARNLHSAARLVRERFEGRLPPQAEDLRGLPGVGDYTAGAVGSIAFNQVVPAVDGNVRRVLSRLFDLVDPGPAELRRLASALVDPTRPGDFNQALMELGARVCTPRGADCGSCPVSGDCIALRRGTVALRPPRRARNPLPFRTVAVAVIRDGKAGRFLVRRRSDSGLLAGMWEFPGVDVEGDVHVGWEEARDAVPPTVLPPSVDFDPAAIPEISHTFTHLRAFYRGFLFRVSEPPGEPAALPSEYRWATPVELSGMALSRAQQRILDEARGVAADPEMSHTSEAG